MNHWMKFGLLALLLALTGFLTPALAPENEALRKWAGERASTVTFFSLLFLIVAALTSSKRMAWVAGFLFLSAATVCYYYQPQTRLLPLSVPIRWPAHTALIGVLLIVVGGIIHRIRQVHQPRPGRTASYADRHFRTDVHDII